MPASFDAPRLVPPQLSPGARHRPPTSSALVVESARGDVYGSLHYARRRGLSIEFSLDVVNATDEPLLATIYAVPLRGDDVPLPPYSLWVDARTEAYLDLPLNLLAAWTSRAVAVRLQGHNLHQRLEARLPRSIAPAYFLLGILCAIVFAVLGSMLHPSIAAFAAPSSAIAGDRVSFEYAFGGVGRGTWELVDLRGGHIDGGELDARHGAITVAIPRSDAQSTYVVRIADSSALGHASAERPLVAYTPHPPDIVPFVSSLSIDRAVVRDGASVVVRYRTNAREGDVLAADAQGTIWAEAPVVASGITTLVLPKFGHEKELQIRVIVKNERRIAQAGVGLQVMGQKAL